MIMVFVKRYLLHLFTGCATIVAIMAFSMGPFGMLMQALGSGSPSDDIRDFTGQMMLIFFILLAGLILALISNREQRRAYQVQASLRARVMQKTHISYDAIVGEGQDTGSAGRALDGQLVRDSWNTGEAGDAPARGSRLMSMFGWLDWSKLPDLFRPVASMGSSELQTAYDRLVLKDPTTDPDKERRIDKLSLYCRSFIGIICTVGSISVIVTFQGMTVLRAFFLILGIILLISVAYQDLRVARRLTIERAYLMMLSQNSVDNAVDGAVDILQSHGITRSHMTLVCPNCGGECVTLNGRKVVCAFCMSDIKLSL